MTTKLCFVSVITTSYFSMTKLLTIYNKTTTCFPNFQGVPKITKQYALFNYFNLTICGHYLNLNPSCVVISAKMDHEQLYVILESSYLRIIYTNGRDVFRRDIMSPEIDICKVAWFHSAYDNEYSRYIGDYTVKEFGQPELVEDKSLMSKLYKKYKLMMVSKPNITIIN